MNRTGKIFFLFFVTIFFNVYSSAGTDSSVIDSLELLLKNSRIDTDEKIRLLNELSSHVLLKDLDVAKKYAIDAYALLDKCNNPAIRGKTYLNMAFTHMLSDSGLYFSQQAISEFQEGSNESDLANAYNRYAKLLNYHGRYEEALGYLIKALTIFEKENNHLGIADSNCDLAALYKELFNYDMSYKYANIALDEYKKLNNKEGIADANYFIGEYYFHTNDTVNVFRNVQEQIRLHQELGNTAWLAHSLSNMGDAYMDYTEDYDKALDYLYQSKTLAEEGGRKDVLINTYRKISRAWIFKNKTDSATHYMNLAVALTDSSNITTSMYNDLTFIYIHIKAGKYEEAMESFNTYREKTERLQSDELNNKISQMQIEYETEKKENQIALLEKKKKIANLYITGMAILLMISLLVAFIIIRQIRYKKIISEQEVRIREQKIIEMVKDRQLLATNAVLEGEETERKRLARDLHDGLGGLLSGLKFSLLNVKGSYVASDQSAREFDYAIGLLDNSIQELRRVAQNMMPESLLKLGLKDALGDFCNASSRNKDININYQYFGKSDRIPQKFETSLYRIAQELVNNSIKHSGAQEILVQVIYDIQRVHLTVQDDGKGFDEKLVSQGRGIGLASIRSRVSALNGRIEINTEIGKGTEVIVEFFLNEMK